MEKRISNSALGTYYSQEVSPSKHKALPHIKALFTTSNGNGKEYERADSVLRFRINKVRDLNIPSLSLCNSQATSIDSLNKPKAIISFKSNLFDKKKKFYAKLRIRNIPINKSTQPNVCHSRHSMVPIRYKKDNKESLNVIIKNTKLKQMALEQFAILGQVKESQINDFVVLSRLDLMNHFLSLGFQRSIIIENIAEYMVRVMQRLNFKGYYKLLTEGLLSNIQQVQKQICYSIYSSFKDKFYLSKVYSFFDDPLWKIVINDLLVINTKITEKQTELKQFKAHDNARQYTRRNSFLIIDLHCIKNKFEIEVEEEQEVKRLIEKKDTYLTFDEFNAIEFSEGVPQLLYFVTYLIYGEELLNYYTELIGIKSFQYSITSKGKEVEYIVNRKVIDHYESNLKRENKQITKIIRKFKPIAKQYMIDVVIKFFHAFKLNFSDILDFSLTITKERFISMSVSSKNQYRQCFLGK